MPAKRTSQKFLTAAFGERITSKKDLDSRVRGFRGKYDGIVREVCEALNKHGVQHVYQTSPACDPTTGIPEYDPETRHESGAVFFQQEYREIMEAVVHYVDYQYQLSGLEGYVEGLQRSVTPEYAGEEAMSSMVKKLGRERGGDTYIKGRFLIDYLLADAKALMKAAVDFKEHQATARTRKAERAGKRDAARMQSAYSDLNLT